MPDGFDLIGDIHGRLAPLQALLRKLGYREEQGVWRHASRQVIFLGDFIDRGPDQREVVQLVRAMVDAGEARAVMGNHEFNALAFHTEDPEMPGTWLRRRTLRNIRQHLAFLNAYLTEGDYRDELEDVLGWFMSLPLFLEFDDLRVVHACWDRDAIELLRPQLAPGNRFTPSLLIEACQKDKESHYAVKALLTGKELKLPEGASFHDKEGTRRHRMRIRWWESGEQTYRSLFMGPESAETHIPDDPVDTDHLLEYGHNEPPVFLGHYWLEGEPAPLADNVACLDYSVAKPGGALAAYRWDGEQTLSADKYVTVPS
jgi:hypothetical protein